ncbi:hypothetical protein Csa_012869, partial [Cucumis sativus]
SSKERTVDSEVFLLQEGPKDWWMLEENMRGSVSLEEFKEIFNGKYFLKTYKKERRDEFQNLEQSELTVIEYEKKFKELSKYAMLLVDVDNLKLDTYLKQEH